MEFFILYLLTSISKIAAVTEPMGFFAFMSLVSLGGLHLLVHLNQPYNKPIPHKDAMLPHKKTVTKLKLLTLIFFIIWSFGRILPTERDLAIIIGGGVTYQAITSDKGKEIGGKVVEIIMRKVDEVLESNPNSDITPSSDSTPDGIKKGIAPNVELDNNIEYKST